MSIRKGIGYGSMADAIYLGKQDKLKGHWIGEKEDITNDFLFVLDQYIPENSSRTIAVDGKDSLYIHFPNTKEAIVKIMKFLETQLEVLVEGKSHDDTGK